MVSISAPHHIGLEYNTESEWKKNQLIFVFNSMLKHWQNPKEITEWVHSRREMAGKWDRLVHDQETLWILARAIFLLLLCHKIPSHVHWMARDLYWSNRVALPCGEELKFELSRIKLKIRHFTNFLLPNLNRKHTNDIFGDTFHSTEQSFRIEGIFHVTVTIVAHNVVYQISWYC